MCNYTTAIWDCRCEYEIAKVECIEKQRGQDCKGSHETRTHRDGDCDNCYNLKKADESVQRKAKKGKEKKEKA